MKIFISWSGARSKAVAEAIQKWLRIVLQATEPWVSSRNIDNGSVWQRAILDEIKTSNYGIVCLTKDNLSQPWLHFEAGALAKLEDSRVFTLLVDVVPSDVSGPLTMFQHTSADGGGLFRLVSSINEKLPKPLSTEDLKDTFDIQWPRFEQLLKAAREIPLIDASSPRSPTEILAEVLEVVRSLNQKVSHFEEKPPHESILSALRQSMYQRNLLDRLRPIVMSDYADNPDALWERLTDNLGNGIQADQPNSGGPSKQSKNAVAFLKLVREQMKRTEEAREEMRKLGESVAKSVHENKSEPIQPVGS
jgi:hypothetical protein